MLTNCVCVCAQHDNSVTMFVLFHFCRNGCHKRSFMEKCIQCNAQCTALQNENEQKTKQSLKLITEKKLPAE